MDVLVALSSLLIGYLLLRSRGGEGLSIKFELGPASSQKGKANRLVLGMALAVWAAGLTFMIFGQQGNSRTSAIMAVIAGAIVALIFLIKDRAKK